MEIKVKLSHLRIAPRKVRLIADLIRGKKADEARVVLQFSVKKAALPMLKLLNSALASAKNIHGIEGSNLYISKVAVDEGPKLKRWRARSRGQAFGIQKKTSHINLVLKEIKETKKKVKKTTKKKEVKKEEIKKEKPKFKREEDFKKPITGKTSQKIFRRKAF